MDTVVKNVKKTINGWALFDWANSAYALVISTAIFPIYFVKNTPDVIEIGSISVTNSALYSFAVTFSYILIAFASPILSGMADYSGRRMFFLKLFTMIGSLACVAMYFFKGEPQLWLGTSAFILATIGFSGSLVFYDSYLPIIATKDRFDKISAKGFAAGYIGSVILLLFILWMIMQPATFGFTDEGIASRLGFMLVGIWWLGFAQVTFRLLPKDNITKGKSSLIMNGFKEIKKVFGELKDRPDLKKFLTAFFFYFAGVQTILYLATVFAEKILSFETFELIIIVLVLQIVAIGGAYLFAHLSKLYGNKSSLIAMILIWIGICIGAHFINSKMPFYFLAGLVGLVMGGIQSLSRSTYSKMLKEDEDDLTSYYSFYDVLYKVSIVVGTFAFGIVDNLTDNMRYSVLVLAMFFVIGLFLLMKTDFKKAMEH